MASLSVLPAAADDLLQIAALEEQCFSLPHTLDQLRYELEDDLHDLFIVKDGQEVLGYVGYYLQSLSATQESVLTS